MGTRVPIRSGPKPNAAFPPPQWWFSKNFVIIGPLVAEIFKFENVHRHTDRHTDRRRLDWYTISLPSAFGSGELITISLLSSCLWVSVHGMVFLFLVMLFKETANKLEQNKSLINIEMRSMILYMIWAASWENLSSGFLTRSNHPTQTGLYKHRRWFEAWNFRFRKLRDCTNYVVKTKGLVSCVVTDLRLSFSHNRAHI